MPADFLPSDRDDGGASSTGLGRASFFMRALEAFFLQLFKGAFRRLNFFDLSSFAAKPKGEGVGESSRTGETIGIGL